MRFDDVKDEVVQILQAFTGNVVAIWAIGG